MKLPSERIREIATEKGIPNHEAVPAWIIASYLDEQAKENQPCEQKHCEHIHSESVWTSSGKKVYRNMCNDCGELF